MPSFLALPARPVKPRSVGLTHVLDKGSPALLAESVLMSAGAYLDVWKFGWGTSYVDTGLAAKLALLAEHDVLACTGGTLLEIAWSQGRTEAFLDWAADVGFGCVEVSRGVVPMPLEDKRALIERAATSFTVLSEVGSKDPREEFTADQWRDQVAADLAAGASRVILEGRESGSVGLYRSDGGVRSDVVRAVLSGGGLAEVFFEAPRKDQQAWFIREFGPDVNLANIALDDVVPLETLRLGLRADTWDMAAMDRAAADPAAGRLSV